MKKGSTIYENYSSIHGSKVYYNLEPEESDKNKFSVLEITRKGDTLEYKTDPPLYNNHESHSSYNTKENFIEYEIDTLFSNNKKEEPTKWHKERLNFFIDWYLMEEDKEVSTKR